MTTVKQLGAFLVMLFSILGCEPALSQQSDETKRSGSLDGPTGLFKVWDAEPLYPGEANFSIGANHFHRDPGELSIITYPMSTAIGIFRNFEVLRAGMLRSISRRQASRPTGCFPVRFPCLQPQDWVS